MKLTLFLIMFLCLSKLGICQTVTGIPDTDEMTKTSQKAMNMAKANDYAGFNVLFHEDIIKKEDQLKAIFNFLKDLIEKEGIPGDDDIQVRITRRSSTPDSIYVIAFMFRNPDNSANPYSKEVSFNYRKEYGTNTIAGINYTPNPLSAQGMPVTLNKLDSFLLNSKDIRTYLVYYDEGENKKTVFGKNKGVFELEGNKVTSISSKIDVIFDQVFKELRKAKLEKSEEFRTALNRGKNTEFIQISFLFDNLPYGIFIYLPVKTESNYKDKIIIRQQQGANLGYQYYIDIKNNDKLVELLKSIIKTNWGSYYTEKL